MKKPTLVVLAAGMGSRFGGLKQMASVGPAGQYMLEYTIYDAARGGFGDAVVVISKAMEEEFNKTMAGRLAKLLPLRTAYQEMTDLPEGFALPEGRVKPWGTGHAVRAARQLVDSPFAVVNADDFYGAESYRLMADFLRQRSSAPPEDNCKYAMAGYRLSHTLSENGSVSRGVCGECGGLLTGIVERTRIEKTPDGIAYTENDGADWTPLPPDTTVSMNFWGLTPDFFPALETLFIEFLQNTPQPERAEFYLPGAVNTLMERGETAVRVLRTCAQWCGVTYAGDLPLVQNTLQELTAQGFYPETFRA